MSLPITILKYLKIFLNQARAWFLEIDPVRIVGMRACVCMCVCVSAPEAINNQWCDIDLIWLVKKVPQLLYGDCSCYR